jgi:PAS domain S-box-containing protein
MSLLHPFARLPEPHLAALIIENAVEYAIFTLDEAGNISSWSPGAARILGYSADEVVGLSARQLFTAADLAARIDELELRKALETGRAEDSRWHLRKDGSRFWANGVTMRFQHGGEPALLKIMRDETASKLADEQRVLLLNELNHRVKNTLSTVQSIAEQTLRAAGVEAETRCNLTDRLIALSDAHDVLLQENWAGADMRAILDLAIAPHEDAAAGRFELDGPAVRLSSQQAVSLSLVLHELATNALKHGAIKVAGGKVCVTWNIGQDGEGRRYLTFLWQESGGPAVEPPARRGFGSRLIDRAFDRDGGGKAVLDYAPEGVRCVVTMALSSPEETPILNLRQAP